MEAKSSENAHRKDLPTDEEMNLILSYQDERKISKNLEISYENVIYQIKTNTKGYRLQHSMVTVCKDLNDIVTLVCQGKILDYTCHERAKPNAAIVDTKQLGSKVDTIKNNAKKYTPPANHPWRHFIINPTATEAYAQKTHQ